MRLALELADYDALIHATINGAPLSSLVELVGRLPPLSLERSALVYRLQSKEPRKRVDALTIILMELGYGIDPQFAFGLGQALVPVLSDPMFNDHFRSSDERERVLLSAIRSTSQSALLIGEFRRCIAFLERWLDPAFRRFAGEFPSTHLLKSQALAYQLRIKEARSAYLELTEAELASAPDAPIAWGLIAPFFADALQPDETFDYAKAVERIISETLVENRTTVLNWVERWAVHKLTPSLQEWVHARIAALVCELDRIEALTSDKSLADGERFDEIMRRLQRFQSESRTLLLCGANPSYLELHGIASRISYAAGLNKYLHPTRNEIDSALAGVIEAEGWCREKGNRYGLLDSLQAQRALHIRAENPNEAHKATRRLYEELRTLRAESRDFEVRAAISRVYRGVILDLCSSGLSSDPETCFSAIEFRRGLLVSDHRRPASWPDPDSLHRLQPSLLGHATHYLGLTVFDEDDPIAASLYCSTGVVSLAWVPLTPRRLRMIASSLNPSFWRNTPSFCGELVPDPRRELSSLLDLVRVAIEAGIIKANDHVCISADEPIHAVPLQYLSLMGRPAFATLSFSRVASLADARLIFERSSERPASAAIAFIPAVREKDLWTKAEAVERQALAIEQYGIPVSRLDGPGIDRKAIMNALKSYDLVHVQAHGKFDAETNPMKTAGLLVCDDGQFPLRGSPRAPLLTPEAVLNEAALRSNSHVSLSACVSGLGRRGAAGDTLGLELALRLCGAASVVASHWDISWEVASAFFAKFYRRWLKHGQTRAQAWRSAILDQGSDPKRGQTPEEAMLAACAFSLFGDWR